MNHKKSLLILIAILAVIAIATGIVFQLKMKKTGQSETGQSGADQNKTESAVSQNSAPGSSEQNRIVADSYSTQVATGKITKIEGDKIFIQDSSGVVQVILTGKTYIYSMKNNLPVVGKTDDLKTGSKISAEYIISADSKGNALSLKIWQ